jgi:hypothetical protein
MRHRLRPPAATPPVQPVVVLLLGLLSSGCQPARIPLPAELATAERMPVSGRQGLILKPRLRFGPYAAESISRSWTRGRDRGGTALARHSERRQTYRFILQEGETPHWFVACRASVERVRIDVGGGFEIRPGDEAALFCNLQSVEDRLEAWELELREQHGRPLSGSLTAGGGQFDVVGTDRIDGALPLGSTTGYQLRGREGIVAAVEVMNRGAVWLHAGLNPDQRPLLAAAAAALLLLEDLYETIGE